MVVDGSGGACGGCAAASAASTAAASASASAAAEARIIAYSTANYMQAASSLALPPQPLELGSGL